MRMHNPCTVGRLAVRVGLAAALATTGAPAVVAQSTPNVQVREHLDAAAGEYEIDVYRGQAPANDPSVAPGTANDPVPAVVQASGPRAGDYTVTGYGRNPLRLGTIRLSPNGHYRWKAADGKLLGEGRFRVAGGRVVWDSGPLQRFGGDFETDRGGREHKIYLNRGTIARNHQ